jgi:hypothetical protein
MEKKERSEALGFLEEIIWCFSLRAMVRPQRKSLLQNEMENQMLVRHNRLPRRAGVDIVMSTIALPAGIPSISYGYYRHSRVMLAIGLIITLAGILAGLRFLLISKET